MIEGQASKPQMIFRCHPIFHIQTKQIKFHWHLTGLSFNYQFDNPLYPCNLFQFGTFSNICLLYIYSDQDPSQSQLPQSGEPPPPYTPTESSRRTPELGHRNYMSDTNAYHNR